MNSIKYFFQRLWAVVATLFCLDLRSLALCRICAGLIIIGDLFSRSLEFRMHYTNLGVLPRCVALVQTETDFPSLYLLSDSATMTVLIMLVHGLVGLALLLGFRTRITTVIAWFFQFSLMKRNYLVNNGGDATLVCLLFWAMFVPWGRRFSLDGLCDQQPPDDASDSNRYFSPANICLIGQLFIIYWVSVYHKLEPSWLSGKAVYYALQSDLYSRSTRELVLPYPNAMAALTYLTLVGESLGALVLLSPEWRSKALACFSFISMHLGFGLFLRIGIFAFTPPLTSVALLPTGLWDRLPGFSSLLQSLAVKASHAVPWSPRNYSYRLSTGGTLLLLALHLHCWVEAIGTTFEVTQAKRQNPLLTPATRWIGHTLGLTQRWHLFVQLDRNMDGWVLVEGVRDNGESVDIWQGRKQFSWDKPTVVSEQHQHFRWPTPMVSLSQTPALQAWFMRALILEWNENNPQDKVWQARFYFVGEQSFDGYLDSPGVPKLVCEWKMQH